MQNGKYFQNSFHFLTQNMNFPMIKCLKFYLQLSGLPTAPISRYPIDRCPITQVSVYMSKCKMENIFKIPFIFSLKFLTQNLNFPMITLRDKTLKMRFHTIPSTRGIKSLKKDDQKMENRWKNMESPEESLFSSIFFQRFFIFPKDSILP